MTKKILVGFLTVVATAGMVVATPALKWSITGTSSPADWLGDQNGTALSSSQTDPTIGCFVQLIYASGGTIDPIDMSNLDGHGGTDVVVAWGYCGFGTGVGIVEGYFVSGASRQANVSAYVATVDQFFIRTWNAPVNSAGSYTLGYAPIGANGGATYYGDSALHTLASNAVADDWKLTSGFDTTIAVVPEPSSLALLIVGVGMVAIRRFRRS